MADYDRRPRGGRGGYNNRKRYRDEDDYDRRPQRRRYEDTFPVKLRKQLLAIAESPLKRVEEEISVIAKLVADNYEDEEVRNTFYDLTLQLVAEQPFKIPFVATVVLSVNQLRSECAGEVLARAAQHAETAIAKGDWRDVKLHLKFLGALQPLLEGEGIWPVLEELFARAVDLQTTSSDDTLGTELVRVILFTIPYIMAFSPMDSQQKANDLLDKTDIIASTPHALEALVDAYPGNGKDQPEEPTSVISLLQRQLQAEAIKGWELLCIPKPWKTIQEENMEEIALEPSVKHTLPPIAIPEEVNAGLKPLFPEIYFSVYADQDVETVPPTSNIASSILRDSIIDTINILDYNRLATARFLIDLDCYFSPGTFVKRATPFDRLRDVEDGRSTWKPEDVAVDAVFSQLFQLPSPEHKLIYYHSVLTESCKIAPAAIAPSLGRAIRWLYRNVDSMDLELSYRFMDWFAHHLSNFGFTWKWTEWIDDVELPNIHPKKAFIQGALDKEIRLSFAQRIKGTLPAPYQPLITEAKEKDTPDFKYNNEDTPFAPEGREILQLLRIKAPEDQIEPVINKIHELATTLSLPNPLCASTDAYVTAICFIGSKSLSHVLSCIERCKDRLLALESQSEEARRQVITSVMDYWRDQPGVGVNIIDKLLNYTILTPMSVIEWALIQHSQRGASLAEAPVYEMVSSTVYKVTNRVRQIVTARNVPNLPEEQKTLLEETLERERLGMKDLFKIMEDALVSWATGSKDEAMEIADNGDSDEKMLIRAWGERWLRVFRRKYAVEEAFVIEENRKAADVRAGDGMVEV